MTLKLIPLDVLTYTTPEIEHKEGFDALVESVTKQGVLTPIIVRPIEGGYEVINGRYRVLAAIKAGLAEIPAAIYSMTDIEVAQINIMTARHKVPTKPNEYGNQIERLVRAGYTLEVLADRLGINVQKLRDMHDKRDKDGKDNVSEV